MRVVERGTGTPIVLIPGIQGRWAYMGPAIEALAEQFRVITFDLCGEPGCAPFDPARGVDTFTAQVDAALDAAGLRSAVVCGVSFGGLIAARFAARRPERTSALILVSTPGPGFHLRRRHELYVRKPWLFGPVFLAEVPHRVRQELQLAIPSGRDRRRFSYGQVKTFLRAPFSLSRMATRARLIATLDTTLECERIDAPTLVVSGEPALDHVVSVDGSSQYGRLIRNAQAVRLESTGHLGYITKPALFAEVVKKFVDQRHHAAA